MIKQVSMADNSHDTTTCRKVARDEQVYTFIGFVYNTLTNYTFNKRTWMSSKHIELNPLAT